MSRRPRVAFVVARCGEDVFGGAERLAFDLASRLGGRCEPTILTSCARDYRTWRNEFAPGPGTIGAVQAVRFAVDRPRDPAAFDRLSERIARDPKRAEASLVAAWAAEQGPRVAGLADHLAGARARGEYDAVYFLSYLYFTTYGAIGAAGAASVLMPLAHAEWMLDVPFYRDVFAAAGRFVFLTDEERGLVARTFPELAIKGPTIGTGIDVPAGIDPERFRARYELGSERLLVYVGRVDRAKGIEALVRDFAALRAADPRPRTLVLAGPVTDAVPAGPGVRSLGPIDDRTKFDALAAAEAVVVPSSLESLSLLALEALATGTPIVVNGASDVLVGHCRRSHAGLWYARTDEFVEIFRSDLCGARDALGRAGRDYVAQHYTWDRVAEAHLALIERRGETRAC